MQLPSIWGGVSDVAAVKFVSLDCDILHLNSGGGCCDTRCDGRGSVAYELAVLYYELVGACNRDHGCLGKVLNEVAVVNLHALRLVRLQNADAFVSTVTLEVGVGYISFAILLE